ncbi:glycosyltransferase family 2 protein [Amycolatopsis minnesotensis]|uniref:Cellulose synthase/poly-beta-1,6-N-acetylglucosamine synthase-like glycosyltransferase n=1 Tax=Amycolatopsis minnesotensis TaxID=337894 RepID=A0ABN2QIL6_9PSEU
MPFLQPSIEMTDQRRLAEQAGEQRNGGANEDARATLVHREDTRYAKAAEPGAAHAAFAPNERWHQHTLRVLSRPASHRRPPNVAVVRFVEAPRIESRFGKHGLDRVLEQVAWILRTELSEQEHITPDEHGGVILTLCGAANWQVKARLGSISTRLARLPIELGDEHLTITPVIGWADAADRPVSMDPHKLVERATEAAELATSQLDLIPRKWAPPSTPKRKKSTGPLRTTLQSLATLVLGIAVPFALLVSFYADGIDLATPVYLVVTASLVVTAIVIWTENFFALDPDRPPKKAAAPEPAASAIIPAYLPNEAATIVDTLHAFLRQDYGGPLQVILAYNTPTSMPIEAELHDLAARDPRLVVLKVPYSTSKAQNVNAALELVTGEFVGVFDADHHPAPDAFGRAWRWLSHGADVVQGHCLIRNGDASWVARTVAVEFESIYAVNHPGRAKLHGFGLFGGSNGFWRTQVLHETRMHGQMLTEDIDSSIRVLLSGRTVVNDPALISRELAPATLSALWKQRVRWAQGWFQVSRRHLGPALRSNALTVRNKLGITFLLGWREVYPWLSIQMIPVVAFIFWRDGGFGKMDWFVPVFVLCTIYTLSSGPSQVLFAWRLAAPDVRKHPRWFLAYLVVSTFFYTEFKNHVARVAQIKELTGERKWAITPRQAPSTRERTA